MTDQRRAAPPREVDRLLKRWAVVLILSALFALWASCRITQVVRQLPRLDAHAANSAAQAELAHDRGGRLPESGLHADPAAATPWYRCTMPECGDGGSADPQSRCPVCGMKRELIAAQLGAPASNYAIQLSERARSLANVAAEPALRRPLFKRIRTVGKVSYDETRRQVVSAYTAGRIDRLYADFTGMIVEQGDRLAEIYSPDLISLQDEYLRRIRAKQSSDKVWRSWALSSRRKLELLGFSLEQVRSIEKADEPATHLILHAPISGTIVRKNAITGLYVSDGELLFEIADLTHIWLVLDLYEMDLPWIHPFQTVRVTAESLPGEEFAGRIIFVDPVVDTTTRTVKVRVQVDNPERKLKPELFVTAEIVVALDEGGRAVPPQPASAYACPTHPWERSESAASCPICNTELTWTPAPADSAPQVQPVLCVPKEAVLQTGERVVIYRQTEPGSYEALAVQIGPLAHGDSGRQFYPVLGGLGDDQLIVTRGNFLIDSQMQIAHHSSVFGADNDRPVNEPVENKHAADHQPGQHPQANPEQTTCPVMGGKIDLEVFTLYKGIKVFFCCPGCEPPFRADPEKYIPKLPPAVQARIRQAERTPEGT